MVKDWSKKTQSDPARVVSSKIGSSLSDWDIKRYQSKISKKNEITKNNRLSRVLFYEIEQKYNLLDISINGKINLVKLSGKEDCDNFIHTTAIQILRHANLHGDASSALSLYEAMPKGIRRERLVHWFHRFSPIYFTKKRNKSGVKPKNHKNYVEYNINKAVITPFYNLTI